MDITQGLKITTFPVGNKTVDCSCIIKWAETWDWGVGKIVAKRLADNEFNDWESIVVLTIDDEYAGFCILEKRDDYGTDIDPDFTPFITAVYIEQKFRGCHLSKILLESASNFALSLGFNAVYLISSQQNFYEKFGFEKFVQTVTCFGTIESVYKKSIQ